VSRGAAGDARSERRRASTSTSTPAARPEGWGERTGTVADLSPEQRAAIEAAVRMDYDDTPRGATLADVPSALPGPPSTLRYGSGAPRRG
jgi:predicted DNA binding protein